jgi:transcriptional regulator with XRE-family HTH domain
METDNFRIIETRATSLLELGVLIRRKRKASKLRIDDAAALCGVSVGTLSRLENGKAAVTTDKVLQVLDGLGMALLVVDRERLGAALPAVRSEK